MAFVVVVPSIAEALSGALAAAGAVFVDGLLTSHQPVGPNHQLETVMDVKQLSALATLLLQNDGFLIPPRTPSVENLLGMLTEQALVTTSTVFYLFDATDSAINSAYLKAAGEVSQARADLGGYANLLYSRALLHSDDLYNRSYAEIQAAETASFGHADGLYNRSYAEIQAAEAASFGHADDLYNRSYQDLQARSAQDRSYTDNQVTTAKQLATDLSNTAETNIANAVTSLTAADAEQGNRLEQKIVNGVTTAETFATAAALKAGADAVARTEAVLQPQIAKLQAAVDTCLEPLCDTVTPNASQLGRLGGLLRGLEDLGLVGLLLALATEAAVDPAAAAAQAADVLGWTTDVATGLRDAVLG